MKPVEAEQAQVAGNHERIARFGQKIQTILARVWGRHVSAGDAATPTRQKPAAFDQVAVAATTPAATSLAS